MPEYQEYLAMLEGDPSNQNALVALQEAVADLDSSEAHDALAATRKTLTERGEIDAVIKLLDVEINAASDTSRRADLLLQKGHLFVDELLNEKSGVECFENVLKLRPDDEDATDILEHLGLVRENWKQIVEKYLIEAKASTDRGLTTSLYLSIAETYARYEPAAPEVEEFLQKALEVDQTNVRAANHLERLYRRREQWSELAEHLERRVDAAGKKNERIAALISLAELAAGPLSQRLRAVEAMKKVVNIDPGNARALSLLADAYQADENWSALVMLYTGALKARRRGSGKETEVGMLLQIAMLHWKRLSNVDAAEEFFRRIRKLDPAHPAALEFYRAYYHDPAHSDVGHLLQVLRQALKSVPTSEPERRHVLSVEIASLAENELGNPEKAIDAWKAILRTKADGPQAEQARTALKRLYARTQKWNALLDLSKEEVDRLPKDDIAGRIAGLRSVVEIYRDQLKLDVMVINTYNSILALDPTNADALDSLAAKYEELSRWNDLVAILNRKAENDALPLEERALIYQRIASLWVDRFGNYAQAVKPLERILDLAGPGSSFGAAAASQLKDIYTRRRQWRALITLLGREAETFEPAERRQHLSEMARLAAERLGDNKLAIEQWNRVLELPGSVADPNAAAADLPMVFDALAHLYEREKRYLALADIYHRQRKLAVAPAAAVPVLEKLGSLYADRLRAPAQAAEAYRDILTFDPKHTKAARQLRELYAAAGDFDALEEVYGSLGHWEELVDALHAVADRRASRDDRLSLLERAARIASEHVDHRERVARAYERILSVEPTHLAAAQSLVPIYRETRRWARLLATYEVLLGHAAEADDKPEQLRLLADIRELCENDLGSKAQAFEWAARSWRLAPDDESLLAELERLGAEADAWQEVTEILASRAAAAGTADTEKLRLYRELAKIASTRLHKPERAVDYLRRLLELAPDDPEAMDSLEEIATQQADWPELLNIYRRRAAIEGDRSRRLELLFKIALIEEERLADHDAAVATYQRVLEVSGETGPESRRALKALSKLHEAGGDWAGVAKALEGELDLATDDDTRVSLHLRIGALYERSLDRADDALSHYKRALDQGPSAQVYSALEPFLGDERIEVRGEVAALLLPAYEQADDSVRVARCLECLRAVADESDKVSWDRRLLAIYSGRLARPHEAFEAGLRIMAADPADGETRRAAIDLADGEGVLPSLTRAYEDRLSKLENSDGKDVPLRLELATELAQIYDDRLEDPDSAEVAWTMVLDLDPRSHDAYNALDRLYRNAEDWGSLRQILIERVENTDRADDKLQTLTALCELSETILADTEGAISGYRQILDLDPDNMAAYKALERLYADAENWKALEETLAAEAGSVTDDADRAHLLLRRAMLRSQFLGDVEGAVDLVEDLLVVAPGQPGARDLLEDLINNAGSRLRVAKILEPIYKEDGSWLDLAKVLAAQAEFAGGTEKGELFARIAEIEEVRLGDSMAAMKAWRNAIEVDASDERARENLVRLADDTGEHDQIAAALEAAGEAADTSDLLLRTELAKAVAVIYDERLSDPIRATRAYQHLFDIDPSNPDTALPAAEALSRLYEAARAWDRLPTMLRKRAEWSGSGAERRELLSRVAEIEQHEVGDKDAAIKAWRDVLLEDADDSAALAALAALYRESGAANELSEVLRRRVDIADTAEAKIAELRELAALFEIDLSSPDEAISAHHEILDHSAEDQRSLGELTRLYRAQTRWPDLLETIERRLPLADEPHERASLLFEEAEVLENHLERRPDALERYGDVLEIDPHHEAALARLESMLADDDSAVRASEILEPLHESAGEFSKLAALYERRATVSDDPRRIVADRIAAARVHETALSDLDAAFAAYVAAAENALLEPELPELLSELERLAAEREKMNELVDVYRRLAPDILDGEVQRRLQLDIADLSRAIGNEDVAREHYRKVLDAQPDDDRALRALESLYRDADEPAELYAILSRRAELENEDLDARAQILCEAADLAGSVLKRPDDAIALWEQILELTPANTYAAMSLDTLYRDHERWHDVAQLTERRLGFANTTAEAVELRLALGRLYEEQLTDPESAFENYSAALAGNPQSADARAALERYLDEPGLAPLVADLLEPIYVTSQAWQKLIKIYEIKLEAAHDPAERLSITRYIARLHEDQLEDMEGAFLWYGKVFRENPADSQIRDQLVRLATILESWGNLAHVYQEYLDDESGGAPEVREVALSLATIYDQRLGEYDRGQAAYRRVLELEPDDVRTFASLEAMLYRGERWYALVDCYEEAVGTTLDDDRRQDLYIRLARVHEERLDDSNRAIDAYQAVLNINAENPTAIECLDRLYKSQEQWNDLADLLRKQVDSSANDSLRAINRGKLAETLETKLSDVHAAIDQYELMLGEGGAEPAIAALERLVVEEPYRERIAFLLEPIYRERDWWQKLVVILEAKLPFVSDPGDRTALLREIAEIHESRGGDERLAFKALARAWHEDVGNYEVYEAMGAAAARLGAWEELVAAFEKGIEDQYDFELVGRVLSRIAEIKESQFGDPAAAIDVWRRYLDIEEDNRAALAALDRLLADAGDYEELAKVLNRRAELSEEPSIRQVLFRRLAQVQEEHLDSRIDAIAAYKSVLIAEPTDHGALDALERLYRSERDFTDLSDILNRKIELAEDPTERRSLRFALALVFKTHLADAYEAIGQMQQVLEDNPVDGEALAELDALYTTETMWPELLEIIDRRVEVAADTATKADLAFRGARLVESELLEPDRAIERLAGVLRIDSNHTSARTTLEQMTDNEDTLEQAANVLEHVYRAEGAFAEIAALYEKRLAAQTPDPLQRREYYAALAELHEVSRGDLDASFEVWARALAEQPDDEAIWGQLERLASDRGAWEELATLYEKQLADTVDAELEYRFAIKLASIYEDALGDLNRAAGKHRVALDTGVDEPASLEHLARLYERSGKPSELVEILALQADAAVSEEIQSELLFRIGDVRETQLGDVGAAIIAYRDVLDRQRNHAAARSALERMLVSHIESAEVISILEPIYETDGEAEKLCQLLTIKLGLTEDTLDRAQIYARIAELAETRLEDTTRAMDAAGGWLAEDPSSEEALSQLERLAEVGGRWSEVAARLEGIIESSESREVAASLRPNLGAVQLDRLGDLERAERTFVAVRETDPDSPLALSSLERIYRQTSDAAKLAEVLGARAQSAFDVTEKRTAFAEAASLHEGLGDDSSAEKAWKEVLDLDEADREAHAQLAGIFERGGRTEELIEILGVSARFAEDNREERAIRSRIATLFDVELGDLDRAAEAWRAALDSDPTDLAVMDSLESVLQREEDWSSVIELLHRRADVASEVADQVEVYRRMAMVQEQKLESVDDAISTLQTALEIDAKSAEAHADLERLLRSAERWHDLASLYEAAAETSAAMGHDEIEIRYLAAAADVWEGELENPDSAGEILERILSREPNYVPALTRLAKIYERASDWDKCGEVLERALALGPTGTDAAELHFRLGEVELARDGDEQKGQLCYRTALEHDPGFGPAISAIATYAKDAEDWTTYADMLGRRYQSMEAGDERRTLVVELSEVYNGKLGQGAAMVAVLEEELRLAPDDTTLLSALADAYFAARRMEEAADLYSRLGDAAKKARKMKDVAKYRQKAAELFEVQGQSEEALAAYEEAFRIDPTSVATMAGLGRLYLAAADWEKARRVYRSMVLQNIEPGIGITKADVYYNLGYIHAQLGEIPKAKGMMQRGLELDPSHERIKQAMEAL